MNVELLRELGRGGMATVYLARDRHLGREVAVKVLHENLLADEEAVARFEREARVVGKLEHPNILGLYGLTEVKGGRLGLVMPYVRGGTLAERLQRSGGGLPLEEVEHITRSVLRGLAYAHGRGVVHRDIKPGNVFLGEGDGRVLIADFGIARAAGVQTALTQTGASMGTPNYMAPEQIDSVSDVDGQADVYAVGMMMWEMLTGERPWSDETLFSVIFKQKTEDLESPQRRRPEVPDALVEVWRTATRKDCSDRWPSAEAMLSALGDSSVSRPTSLSDNLQLLATEGHSETEGPISPRPSALLSSISHPEAHKQLPSSHGPQGRSRPSDGAQANGRRTDPRSKRTWWSPVHSTILTLTLLISGGVFLLFGDGMDDSLELRGAQAFDIPEPPVLESPQPPAPLQDASGTGSPTNPSSSRAQGSPQAAGALSFRAFARRPGIAGGATCSATAGARRVGVNL